MMCAKSYFFAKLANSCGAYCGPLSLTTVSGTPCLAKAVLSAWMMLWEVVLMSLCISGYLEK